MSSTRTRSVPHMRFSVGNPVLAIPSLERRGNDGFPSSVLPGQRLNSETFQIRLSLFHWVEIALPWQCHFYISPPQHLG